MIRKRTKIGGKKTTKAAAMGKPHRKKKSGGSFRRNSGGGVSGTSASPAWEIDLVHEADQREAFLAEMMLLPSATIGERLACKVGSHGKFKRKIRRYWIDRASGKRTEKVSDMSKFFCVRCGREWIKNNSLNPD